MMRFLLNIVAILAAMLIPTISHAAWTVSPSSISQTVIENQPPVSFSITATNLGATSVSLTWADSINWFKGLTPAVMQMAAAGKSVTWFMPINTQQPYNCNPACPMKPGTYVGALTISGGGSTVSIPVTLTITPAAPPTAPGKVQGVAFILETVPLLSWTANTEPDLAGYKIYVGFVSGMYGAAVGTVTKTTGEVHGLKAGTQYYFTITAYDTSGNESRKSNEVSFTPP